MEKRRLTSGLRRGKKPSVLGPKSSLTLARLFGPTCPSACLLPLSPRPWQVESILHPSSASLAGHFSPFLRYTPDLFQSPNRPSEDHPPGALSCSMERFARSDRSGRRRDLLFLLVALSLRASYPSLCVAHRRSHARLASSNSPESRRITRVTAR